MYAYRTVEIALARLHVVNPATMGAFRGRIKHLQRIGLVPSSPGPGKRITYSFEDVAKWALAMEIAEFGIDPLVIQQLVLSTWSGGIFRKIEKGNHGQNDLLIIRPNAVSHPHDWHMMAHGEQEANLFDPQWYKTKRTMVINVSLMGRELRQALADAESGALDGFLREVDEAAKRARTSEADIARVAAALENRTPGAAIEIRGSTMREQGEDGIWRELNLNPADLAGISKETLDRLAQEVHDQVVVELEKNRALPPAGGHHLDVGAPKKRRARSET